MEIFNRVSLLSLLALCFVSVYAISDTCMAETKAIMSDPTIIAAMEEITPVSSGSENTIFVTYYNTQALDDACSTMSNAQYHKQDVALRCKGTIDGQEEKFGVLATGISGCFGKSCTKSEMIQLEKASGEDFFNQGSFTTRGSSLVCSGASTLSSVGPVVVGALVMGALSIASLF